MCLGLLVLEWQFMGLFTKCAWFQLLDIKKPVYKTLVLIL